MQPTCSKSSDLNRERLTVDVPKDAKLSQVLASVPPVVTPIHDIVMSLAMPVDEVLGALVALEIEGFVESHRGGYIRRPPGD